MTAPLPGHVRELRPEDQCPCQYDECKAHATHEFCTEADSFGAEWLPLCETHIEQFRIDAAQDCIASCDWCKAENVVVAPFRDFEEGTHGPVYDVCEVCRGKAIDRANEEANQSFDGDDDFAEMPELEDDSILDMWDDEQAELERDPEYLADMLIKASTLPLNPILPGDNSVCKHFNLIGPQLVEGQLGFSAHWSDGIQVVIALDLELGVLFWRVHFPYDFYFVHIAQRMERVTQRIVAMGFCVKEIEEL